MCACTRALTIFVIAYAPMNTPADKMIATAHLHTPEVTQSSASRFLGGTPTATRILGSPLQSRNLCRVQGNVL